MLLNIVELLAKLLKVSMVIENKGRIYPDWTCPAMWNRNEQNK